MLHSGFYTGAEHVRDCVLLGAPYDIATPVHDPQGELRLGDDRIPRQPDFTGGGGYDVPVSTCTTRHW